MEILRGNSSRNERGEGVMWIRSRIVDVVQCGTGNVRIKKWRFFDDYSTKFWYVLTPCGGGTCSIADHTCS